MKIAVAYVRVSQEDENPENQKQAILKWANEHGISNVFFFVDYDVSGATPPRQRERYKAMLEFAKENGIKLILFYDLSRLSRNLEDGLLELRNLTDEGFEFKFVAQEFLDYISDPLMRKKVISDFLWFAELYRADIIRRTKSAMERLKNEGKLYHRPRLIHYLASYITNKELKDLTQEDIELAKREVKKFIEPYIKMQMPKTRILQLFIANYQGLYQKFPNAPRGMWTFNSLLRDIGIK